jgi:anti-sigma regulatory factor (Ser/Thr protein kinase)
VAIRDFSHRKETTVADKLVLELTIEQQRAAYAAVSAWIYREGATESEKATGRAVLAELTDAQVKPDSRGKVKGAIIKVFEPDREAPDWYWLAMDRGPCIFGFTSLNGIYESQLAAAIALSEHYPEERYNVETVVYIEVTNDYIVVRDGPATNSVQHVPIAGRDRAIYAIRDAVRYA